MSLVASYRTAVTVDTSIVVAVKFKSIVIVKFAHFTPFLCGIDRFWFQVFE